VVLHHHPDLAAQELRSENDTDGDAYAAYRAFFDRLRPLAESVLDAPAADLIGAARGRVLPLARPGLAFRRLGKVRMLETLRVPPMPVADFVGERFRSELVRAALAAPALHHGGVGPLAPGTAANLLRHELLARAHVRGGPRALALALEAAARKAGVEIRTGARVERVLVRGDRVHGVRLAGGETLEAEAILSTLDPRALFLDLIGGEHLTHTVEHDLRHLRGTGTTAKVHVALRGAPNWACRPGERFAHVRIGESLEILERAFDAVKYGEIPRRPALDVYVPSVEDDSLAPRGCETMSLLVHAVPHEPAGGWTDENRQDLSNAVLDTLELHTPGIKNAVLAVEMLTPPDLEARIGAVKGHLLHGDHALDQLLFRPVAACADGTTPFAGLVLGGSGSHPGGGLTGIPGALAARRLLA
jgi:phytoene dehydrogenase-like protein